MTNVIRQQAEDELRRNYYDADVGYALDLHPLFAALRYADSCNRVGIVAEMYGKHDVISRPAWFVLLGKTWSMCDTLYEYTSFFRGVFGKASRAELDLMMTPSALDAWRAMPERIDVYRGCHTFNAHGLSWSLSPDVATDLVASVDRYRHDDYPAMLLRARVSKRRVVYIDDRGEDEIIVPTRVRNFQPKILRYPASLRAPSSSVSAAA